MNTLRQYVKQTKDNALPSVRSEFSSELLQLMDETTAEPVSLKQHVQNLTALANKVHMMSDHEVAHLSKMFGLNASLASVRDMMMGEPSYRLAVVGVEAILSRVAEGRPFGELARAIRVPPYLMYLFLTQDKDTRTAFKEAVAAAGFKFIEYADAAIEAGDKDKAIHWRWRAERAAPEYFGNNKLKDEQAAGGAVFNLTFDMSSSAVQEMESRRREVYEQAVHRVGKASTLPAPQPAEPDLTEADYDEIDSINSLL